MKLQIKAVPTRNPGQFYWRVTIGAKTTNYADPAGAYLYAEKYLKRYYKESAAFSRVSRIFVNLLSTVEADLVRKLIKSRCRGITPKQYGYLTGIYERQMKAW